MIRNILFIILLLLSGILGAGGVIVIANSIIDDRDIDPAGLIIGIAILFLWTGACALIESKYFTKQQNAWLKFFGLTANKK